MRYQALKTKLYLHRRDHAFLLHLMHASKNLYNEALYRVRQHYFDTGKHLSYVDNVNDLSKVSVNYRILSSSQAQAVIKKVDEAMLAFLGLLKANVKQKVSLPRYLPKEGYYPLVDRMVYKPHRHFYTLPRSVFVKKVSNWVKSLSDVTLKHTKELDVLPALHIVIDTPRRLSHKTIKEITIKPTYDGRTLEIIYVYEVESFPPLASKRCETMGIDFGYTNLVVGAVTTHNHCLIDGLRLKSMNQHYHKTIARLASQRPNQYRLTKRMIKTIEKRNHQMTYGINKAAKEVIEHALKENVGHIIMGYNDTFKDSSFSDQFNQWTKAIPIARLRDKIAYLAKKEGIQVDIINESYTSVSSYIDQDPIKKATFQGKRTHRGLYQSKNGTQINADLNAALNILRKGKPDAVWIGSKGWNTPKRTYLM